MGLSINGQPSVVFLWLFVVGRAGFCFVLVHILILSEFLCVCVRAFPLELREHIGRSRAVARVFPPPGFFVLLSAGEEEGTHQKRLNVNTRRA